MLMKMRSKMQNQKGFTLVELMVVVVILGVLVAIAVPIYNNVSDNAKTKACASNIRIIEGAIEMAKAAGTAADDIDGDASLSPTYIKDFPDCPFDVDYTVANGVISNRTSHFASAATFGKTHAAVATP